MLFRRASKHSRGSAAVPKAAEPQTIFSRCGKAELFRTPNGEAEESRAKAEELSAKAEDRRP